MNFTRAVIYWLSLITTITCSYSANATDITKPSKPLRIAVAANFAPVLKKLLPEFTAKTQIETQIISSATGTLYLQIKHGAPFDIFLAADSARPQRLVDEELAIATSLQTYAVGELALWSAKQSSLSLESLQTPSRRFAIANPKTAPYGKAAKEVLETLKLWHKYQNSLVMGININQTFQQVRSKAVSSGIVANSQLKLNKLSGTVIPQSYYQPIKQQLVILKSSKQQNNAQMFSQFLLTKDIQRLIADYGYQIIPNNISSKSAIEIPPTGSNDA